MWFCKGRALIFDKKYSEAEQLLERSIALDSDHAYAYNALGIAYLEQVPQHPELFARAVAAFHDALHFAPDWAYPMHNLALAYSEQGKLAEAEGMYKLAMRIAPDYSYLPYNLGLLYQRVNRLDEAEQMYRLALKNAPAVTPSKERANIHNALGSLEAARKKWTAAKADYEQALQDSPGLNAANYNLAVLLSRDGPADRAVKLWKANIDADQNEPASRLALAAYLARQKDRPGAIREYEAALALAGKNVAARRELAKLYEADNRWQDAYLQLQTAHQASPQQAVIAEELGDAALKLGQKDEALEAYAAAVKLTTSRTDRKRLEDKRKSAL